MRWAIQLERTALDRRNLIDLLSHAGYQPIEVTEAEIVFSSESFDSLSNANDVWEEAKRLQEVLVNVTEIDPAFSLGPVLELSDELPKRHHFVELKSCAIAVACGSIATITVRPPDGLSPDRRVEWEERQAEHQYQARLDAQRALLEPSIREPRAAKLLQLLKRESHTGESLNKIYELAEGHPSRRKDFQAQYGVTEGEFKRFKDAIHNPVVSGDFARHAYEDKPKTPNPMSLAEAESFVKGIAQRWLSSLRS